MMLAASTMDTVNQVIDSREVLGALLVGGLSAMAGLGTRRWQRKRQLTWSVLYDEPINQGADLWEISYQGAGITDGSLVVLEVRNTGRSPIVERHWEENLSFAFPGREIKGFKVRENRSVHDTVAAQPAATTLPPTELDKIQLPAFILDRDAGFKLMLLLTGSGQGVERETGVLDSGTVTRHNSGRRPYRWLAVAAVFALLTGAGVTAGVRLANDALTPSASCAHGTLALQGSSAFAPVANQVRNTYRQLCGDGATIAITADGSEQGLADLERTRDSGTVAMTDGLPASVRGSESLTRRPVGVVTYAVVANTALRATLPDLFGPTGISGNELRRLFSGAGDPAAPNVVAVGRSVGSGTRVAFAQAFFGGVDPQPATSGVSCTVVSSGSRFCTGATTMELLSFVNSHPGAIGYAEADALPYFPSVQVVAVNGQLPGEAAVKAGNYSFLATEYVWTASAPAGLAASFLDFLTSPAESAALRGHSFIACADLEGTRIAGACSGS